MPRAEKGDLLLRARAVEGLWLCQGHGESPEFYGAFAARLRVYVEYSPELLLKSTAGA